MNSKLIKGLIATVGALALIPVIAGTAMAETNGTPVGNAHQMRFDALKGADNSPSDCSTIGWQHVNTDSPIDSNSRALVTNVCAGDYTDAYTRKSITLSTPVADVKNISYDFRTAGIGAGAPRISVGFNNGDIGYLASSTCSSPIAVSGGTWSRADFTGDVTDCGFNVTGDTGGFYAADGTSSAFEVYAEANPNQVVSYSFLIFDESGNYIVDRVALGTDKLYNYGPKRAVSCGNDENIC